MARWISRIQDYNFYHCYTPGQKNKVSDCLLRIRSLVTLLDYETLPREMNSVCSLMFYEDPNVLTKQQRDDVELRPVINALQRGVKKSLSVIASVAFTRYGSR